MFMLDIVWKVARHVTAWKLWQSGMTRSGFPISPPAPRGQRQRQAPSQAHTFANCRQSVPKARGWMPLTKRCEPQAQPAPLSLPSEWRFSWRSAGPAPSRSGHDGPPGTCCLFFRFSSSPRHPALQRCIPLSSIPSHRRLVCRHWSASAHNISFFNLQWGGADLDKPRWRFGWM